MGRTRRQMVSDAFEQRSNRSKKRFVHESRSDVPVRRVAKARRRTDSLKQKKRLSGFSRRNLSLWASMAGTTNLGKENWSRRRVVRMVEIRAERLRPLKGRGKRKRVRAGTKRGFVVVVKRPSRKDLRRKPV